MKKILLLVVSISLAKMSFAQQQLATLNHNDSISVFYGTNALIAAIDSAVNNDIITLSSGSFTAPVINKSVSIRGAGMFYDTIMNIAPTIIVGNSRMYANNIMVEGVKFDGYIENASGQDNNGRGTENSSFSKCYMLIYSANGFYMKNCTFSHCMVGISSYQVTESVFSNCVVYGSHPFSILYNCVINQWGESYVYNSILIGTADQHGQRWYACDNLNVQHSLGICRNADHPNFFNADALFLGNTNTTSTVAQVFKTLNDLSWPIPYGETYELQDSAATTFLGTDGTQVGIYGGSMPFDPRVSNPMIRRISVATRSTSDGKLPIEIEVISE